jgi:hypothetical protein
VLVSHPSVLEYSGVGQLNELGWIDKKFGSLPIVNDTSLCWLPLRLLPCSVSLSLSYLRLYIQWFMFFLQLSWKPSNGGAGTIQATSSPIAAKSDAFHVQALVVSYASLSTLTFVVHCVDAPFSRYATGPWLRCPICRPNLLRGEPP